MKYVTFSLSIVSDGDPGASRAAFISLLRKSLTDAGVALSFFNSDDWAAVRSLEKDIASSRHPTNNLPRFVVIYPPDSSTEGRGG